MEKITVKHYLNKRLKPRLIDNKKKFPLYVQVNYKGNNSQFKSNAFLSEGIETKYLSEIEFKNNKKEALIYCLNYEKESISQVIETLSLQSNEIDFSNFGTTIKLLSQKIYDIIENKMYQLFLNELKENNSIAPEIFFNSQYSLVFETLQVLNKDFDKNFSEYYQLSKVGFEIFNTFNFTKKNIPEIVKNIRFMKLYQWKYSNGKEKFVKFAKDNFNSFNTSKDTEKYLNSVINTIDKLII